MAAKKKPAVAVETSETVAVPTVVETVASSGPAYPAAWIAFITPFSTAVKKPIEEVTTSLASLVGDPGQEAIDLLNDPEYTPDEDITQAVNATVPKAVLKKAIAGLRKAKPTEASAHAEVSVAAPAAAPTVVLADPLPDVPSDESWLTALKTGGILKVNGNTVIGAVSAVLADQLGYYELPKKVIALMEEQAETLEEPVGEEFYTLQKLVTQRSYSDIFAALGIEGGRFVTEAKKNALMAKLRTKLWPALVSYQASLKGWFESYQTSQMGPNALASLVLALRGGGIGVAQLPPTAPLRDAADGVVNQINSAFAGTGIPVALALAADAQKIRTVLENPLLPLQVGAPNREAMLKKLGVAVSSDYPRLEHDVKKYALSIMNFASISSGQAEVDYILALYQLGTMIPWEKLGRIEAPSAYLRKTRSDLSGIGREVENRFGDDQL